MDICVFSKKGVLYHANKRNAMIGIAVPSSDQKRHYADISNPNAKNIKERYGALYNEIAYRHESGIVTVYGSVPKEISDLRKEVNVYLPEDLAPLDVNVLYYVIGERLIVHSVRTVDTDGTSNWSSIYIELESQGAGVLNVVENLISERIVSVNDEKILVAYTDLKEEVKEELYSRVNQFGVLVERLEDLTGYKQKKAIYSHADNSIMMLIFILVAAMLFALSIGYYASGNANLSDNDNKIAQLENELRQSLTKMRLKKVANPQQVKESVEKTFKARPSAVIHAASEVASLFGVIQSITLAKRQQDRLTRVTENNPEDDVLYVMATVKANVNNLLIDQERLAKSVYETRKWVRSIERSNQSGDGSLMLKIGIYVGDHGGV